MRDLDQSLPPWVQRRIRGEQTRQANFMRARATFQAAKDYGEANRVLLNWSGDDIRVSGSGIQLVVSPKEGIIRDLKRRDNHKIAHRIKAPAWELEDVVREAVDIVRSERLTDEVH